MPHEDFTEPQAPEEVVESDFQDLFVGNIYDGHNKDIWGFEHKDPNQKTHPGACVRFSDATSEALLLKGTSKVPDARYEHKYVAVDHVDEAILREITYFELSLKFSLRFHKMKKLHRWGLRGPLAGNDLARMQSELHRVFDYQGESVK